MIFSILPHVLHQILKWSLHDQAKKNTFLKLEAIKVLFGSISRAQRLGIFLKMLQCAQINTRDPKNKNTRIESLFYIRLSNYYLQIVQLIFSHNHEQHL
jgi:hypothetical protein